MIGVTPADVRWAANLLGSLTDRQWTDAFRSAGFEMETASRFIYRLKQKIAEGQALGAAPALRLLAPGS